MADLTGLPVEVVAQDEPGTFGAAILAGVGSGEYDSVSAAVARAGRGVPAFRARPRRGVPDTTTSGHA